MFVEQTISIMSAGQFFYGRLNKPPRFVAAHTVRGIRGSDGATEWKEPDRVHARGIHAIRSGKVASIRPIPQEMQARLLEIDAEREAIKKRSAELIKEERELLKTAFETSKPMMVKDCENAPY